jgi:competence protein ComEA
MALGYRIILLLSALLIISINFISCHISSDLKKNIVSITNSSSSVLIRLKGEVSDPGVYAVPGGSTVSSVLQILRNQSKKGTGDSAFMHTRLKSGDVLDVAGGGLAVGITRMKSGEQMVLGIPLDPDRMDLEDWSAVPGIGPRMAQRIIDNRQTYGPFHSMQGVLRVPGIGNGKFAAMKKFF